MNKQICAALTKSVLMIALALGVSAVAQSYKHITAKIPFEFTVGDKTLPAGAYTLRQPNINAPYLTFGQGRRSSGTCERLYERDSSQQSGDVNETGLPQAW